MALQTSKYSIIITPERRAFDLNTKEILSYKDLIIILAKRDFNQRYRQTVLGPAWAFINPLLTSLVHMFIFGTIANIDTDNIPRILFYLFSNNLWSVFSSCLNDNSHTFLSNSSLFSKVYFPRIVAPISKTLVILLRWCIQTVVSLPFYLYFIFRGSVVPHYLLFILLPFILVWIGILGSGIGMIVSSSTTRYRDLSMLVGFAVNLWMYITPIVYPLARLDGSSWKVLALINPVSAPCELFRYILFGSGEIVPWALLSSFVITVLLAAAGLLVFNKVEKDFIDTV